MDPDPQHCIQGEQKLIILGRLSTKPVTCVPWADPDRCTRGQCLWRGSAPGSPRRPVDQTQLLYDTMIPAETCTILPAHTEICWSGNCKTVCRSGGWHDNKCQDFRWIVLHCRPHTHPRHTAFITPSPILAGKTTIKANGLWPSLGVGSLPLEGVGNLTARRGVGNMTTSKGGEFDRQGGGGE